ncbi:MAG: hypothetical protein Q7U04_13210, partial [Bacteriovorax sp.]|nr:hypothetical protein [Bacteriovorax sp.]
MKNLFILFVALSYFATSASHAAKLEDFLDRKEIQTKISDKIAEQDLRFGISLGNINVVDGVNLSAGYHYDVEASYKEKYYSRVDRWNLNAGINVGEVLKDSLNIPFTFGMNRESSVYFVRQFTDKSMAMNALPYTPKRLPLNAQLALKNLEAGDFVSMPANLSIAVGLEGNTSTIAPVLVNAKADIFYILSGEFIIQVYKLDSTHVRLKLISKKGSSVGAETGVGISSAFFGVRVLDHQIDRLFERDLTQIGYSYNPGAQFIVDYVFDLSNIEAQKAYNQILNSTLKFKDLVVTDMLNAKDLKDRLISSYEKADALFAADKNLDPKDQRVQRLFKGYNSYRGHTRHLKFSILVASYTNDRTFTESKLNLVDKNENNLEFYYPTYTKYNEGHFGKFGIDLKDQNYQNNFALIPKHNSENYENKNP